MRADTSRPSCCDVIEFDEPDTARTYDETKQIIESFVEELSARYRGIFSLAAWYGVLREGEHPAASGIGRAAEEPLAAPRATMSCANEHR